MRSHEPFDEQQENPEDYGIGEQHLQEKKNLFMEISPFQYCPHIYTL